MNDCESYKWLKYEINRLKKVKEQIINSPGYEFGDEVDFTLRINELKKHKNKIRRKYQFYKDFDLYPCTGCGSRNITLTVSYNIRSLSYDVTVKCEDCGSSKNKSIGKDELKDYLTNEALESQVGYLFE